MTYHIELQHYFEWTNLSKAIANMLLGAIDKKCIKLLKQQ